MDKDFVSREEFNVLKDEVNDIKKEMAESQKLLQLIDKKIDRIDEKLIASDKVEDLRLKPIEKRVTQLEQSQEWLRRTIIGALIGIIIEAIIFVIKMM